MEATNTTTTKSTPVAYVQPGDRIRIGGRYTTVKANRWVGEFRLVLDTADGQHWPKRTTDRVDVVQVDEDDSWAGKAWHVQCLACGHRYNHRDGVTVTHGAGKDWEDSSSYCPKCGSPNESSYDYRMVLGPVTR